MSDDGRTIIAPIPAIRNLADGTQAIDGKTPPYISNPDLRGLGSNYAVDNLWVAYFPLENILGPKFRHLELHLTTFSLPQMLMMTDSVSYKGYSKEIPLKVMNAESKELTLEYIVDENWQNYKMLFNWMSNISGMLNPTTPVVASEKITPSDYIDLRIYLLDNYKKKVIQFVFKNTFIKVFNDLHLDVNNSDVIKHSFTICYDDYVIEDV